MIHTYVKLCVPDPSTHNMTCTESMQPAHITLAIDLFFFKLPFCQQIFGESHHEGWIVTAESTASCGCMSQEPETFKNSQPHGFFSYGFHLWLAGTHYNSSYKINFLSKGIVFCSFCMSQTLKSKSKLNKRPIAKYSLKSNYVANSQCLSCQLPQLHFINTLALYPLFQPSVLSLFSPK